MGSRASRSLAAGLTGLIGLIALAFPSAGASAGSPAGAAAPAPKALEIRMLGDSLIVNGEGARLGGPLSEWTRRLGPPSRRIDRAGGMAVWDSLGIVATMRYPFPDSAPRVAALWFTFFRRDVDFWPAAPFRGSIAYRQPEGARGIPVSFTLRHGLTRKAIGSLGLSWRSGTDQLSDRAALRFTGPGRGDSLEVFFAQVPSSAARLPWESGEKDRGRGGPP
ncbi:MAG: hypothetical protein JF616_11990 [Fibrobacteres bacterium]|nr:hypothetical protein [Fibrobacterota bacterium]